MLAINDSFPTIPDRMEMLHSGPKLSPNMTGKPQNPVFDLKTARSHLASLICYATPLADASISLME